MWVARRGVDASDLEAGLAEARDCGVANLEQIAEAEAAPLGLTVPQCLAYLRDNLHFLSRPARTRGACICFTRSQSFWGWPRPSTGGWPSQFDPRFLPTPMVASSIHPILDKAVAGERLTPDEGLRLLESHDLAAHWPRRRCRHAPAASRSRIAPTTSIATSTTRTSAPRSAISAPSIGRPKHAEGYVLDRDELLQKIQRNGRAGRRSNPDARRPAPGVQARVVRRTAGRHQARTFRKSTSTASARRRFITSPRSRSCRCGRCSSG